MAASLSSLYVEVFHPPYSVADPYPIYEIFRAAGPVQLVGDRTWAVFGYEESLEVLRSDAFTINMEIAGTARAGVEWRTHSSLDLLSRTLVASNPPKHTQLRRAVARSFSRGAVRSMTRQVAEALDPLLDQIRPGEEFDFTATIADELPVNTIAPILGLPAHDWARFRELALQFNAVFERAVSDDWLAAADGAADELNVIAGHAISFRRRRPGPDVITGLVAEVDGGHLDPDDAQALVFQIFRASYQTTSSLISNGLLALLTWPDELARVASNPEELVADTVDECLRFDAPVQSTGRHASTSLVLGGQEIAEDDFVVAIIGAANRDPQVFLNPSQFVVGRNARSPLSYGWGPHRCLGAQLASLEMSMLLKGIFARFDRLELVGEPSWRPSANMRSVSRLPVVFGCESPAK